MVWHCDYCLKARYLYVLVGGVVIMRETKKIRKKMAESEGFEPSIELPLYTLSRGAPSATRPALLDAALPVM